MKVNELHQWQVSTAQAREIQSRLAGQVVTEGDIASLHFVAGVDMSSTDSGGVARGAIVVLSYPELAVVEVETAEERLTLPYIPGLLSFRESPVILAACEKLRNIPDLILVDGQGIAHPRRLGLASHLGLLLDLPTIGCAKSILCGRQKPLPEQAGSYAELIDDGQVVGAALRTRPGVAAIYVSIGHKIGLASALDWVMKCCRGYRLPEPTRLAHIAAGGRPLSKSYREKLFN
jgi:deoxyribonuclease V